jgi:hypothetical protein
MTELDAMITRLQRALTAVIFSSGGLVIKTSSSALAKVAPPSARTSRARSSSSAAKADMAAQSGTVTNAKFNVFVFTVSAAGTLKSYMGTEGAARDGVVFPTVLSGESVIGFVEINHRHRQLRRRDHCPRRRHRHPERRLRQHPPRTRSCRSSRRSSA